MTREFVFIASEQPFFANKAIGSDSAKHQFYSGHREAQTSSAASQTTVDACAYDMLRRHYYGGAHMLLYKQNQSPRRRPTG